MLIQSIKMALKSILSNKMRSFLTMLGVIIGVFSLVVLVSLVSGATGSITDTINELGTDQVDVEISDVRGLPISLEELQTDIVGLDSVRSAAPYTYGVGEVTTMTKSVRAIAIGTTPELAEIQGIKLESGRFFMNPDVENNTNVIVISHEMAIDVIGRSDCVGETVKLGGRSFTVIGVMEKQSSSMMMLMMGTTYRCYMPFTTLVRLIPGKDMSIWSFALSAESDLDQTEQDIKDYLARRYPGDEEGYTVYNESQISDQMGKITGILSILLGGIAGISLLVGGIGIMNIMLVSVTERTREIGIRKAIGARPSVIMLQFLIEAIVLSLMGCLIGIGLSWLAMQVINMIGNVNFGLSVTVVGVAVFFSMAVGIIFGLYPAKKASSMKPIDALRFN
jgi:putative ABC transport system permease protein